MEAARLSCAGVTAWNAVVETGAARPGEHVLVLGTGGVSLFALQFAKLMGCRVTAVTSSEAKAERLRALGADHVVNYVARPDWGGAVRALTRGEGVDLVVETRGPSTIEQPLIATGRFDRIVLLITHTPDHPTIAFSGAAYTRSLATIMRIFMGSRASLEAMSNAISSSGLRPNVDRVFPFAEARKAFTYFMQGDVFGKVVVEIP